MMKLILAHFESSRNVQNLWSFQKLFKNCSSFSFQVSISARSTAIQMMTIDPLSPNTIQWIPRSRNHRMDRIEWRPARKLSAIHPLHLSHWNSVAWPPRWPWIKFDRLNIYWIFAEYYHDVIMHWNYTVWLYATLLSWIISTIWLMLGVSRTEMEQFELLEGNSISLMPLESSRTSCSCDFLRCLHPALFLNCRSASWTRKSQSWHCSCEPLVRQNLRKRLIIMSACNYKP